MKIPPESSHGAIVYGCTVHRDSKLLIIHSNLGTLLLYIRIEDHKKVLTFPMCSHERSVQCPRMVTIGTAAALLSSLGDHLSGLFSSTHHGSYKSIGGENIYILVYN